MPVIDEIHDEYGIRETRVKVPRGEEWRKSPPEAIRELLSDETYHSISTFEKLSEYHENIIATHDKGVNTKHLRLASGNAKRIREELWPFYRFLSVQKFRDTCQFEITRNGHKGDIIISPNSNSEETILVEITRAIDGEDNAIRMEILSEAGLVTGFGPVKKVGRGAERAFVAHNEASRDIDDAQRIEDLVTCAIQKKGGGKYPSGTWLLVDIVENGFAHWGPQYTDGIVNAAKGEAANTLFEKVFLLSDENVWQVK